MSPGYEGLLLTVAVIQSGHSVELETEEGPVVGGSCSGLGAKGAIACIAQTRYDKAIFI